MLSIEEQKELKKELSHISDSGMNEIRVFEMVNNFICNRKTAKKSNVLLLPTKSKIDEIITEDYKRKYGTNYDDNSLESSKDGGKTIIEWLFNNR